MKKRFGFFTVSIFSFLFLALVTGCSDISEDAYVFDSAVIDYAASIKNVTINVTSRAELVSFASASSARTISPDAYNSSDLNFYIGGQNLVDNSKLTVQKVTFVASESSANVGTITVPFNSYNYQFVLAAVPASTDPTSISSNTYIESVLSYAVLSGVAAADLRYTTSTTSINFYLTSDGLTGAGAYSIQFYLKDWSEASLSAWDSSENQYVIDSAEIGLYTISSHSAIKEMSTIFRNVNSSANAISFSDTAVTPGIYELSVTFTREGSKFVFSDKIFILACQTTEAIIGIPDILTNEPEAPTAFTQGYIAPESADGGYYKLVVNWTENSLLETGFEIQLMDISTISTITASTENNETLWDGTSSATNTFSYTNSNFYGLKTASDSRPVWYAGDLSRNSEYAVFYVSLGKRYLARLRAINPIGGSDWSYASSGATSATLASGTKTYESTTGLSSAKTLSASAFASNIINLYRIKYSAGDGVFTPSSAQTSYYFSQSAAGTAIMIPDGTTSVSAYNSGNTITLMYGDLAWSHWAVNSANGDEYPRVFTNIAEGSEVDENETYYVTTTLAIPDVNGSSLAYEKARTQPTAHDGNYYVDTGMPQNYVGYGNLSLYAVYEEAAAPEIVDADYNMSDNMTFGVELQGTGTQPTITIDEGDVIKVVRSDGTYTATRLNLYYTASILYDSVTLTLSKKGGADIEDYRDSARTFGIDLTNLEAGSYTATMYASKSGKNYSYPFTIVLKDSE